MAQKPKVDPHVGRLGYLQALVTEFQETESQDAKEQVLANLANFAYDPNNYQYLRQLQVLDLFLDSLSEENETLVEFAIARDPRKHSSFLSIDSLPGILCRLNFSCICCASLNRRVPVVLTSIFCYCCHFPFS
ncbi:armadillo repeat-containing protein 7 isoform X4 [Microcebus murinus]|uniref:armadillo repeat-containing protein 7 isoform X4 n=1 Tax=Microcebus murinus TaxID=30608 RepID=UPI003F6A9FF2